MHHGRPNDAPSFGKSALRQSLCTESMLRIRPQSKGTTRNVKV